MAAYSVRLILDGVALSTSYLVAANNLPHYEKLRLFCACVFMCCFERVPHCSTGDADKSVVDCDVHDNGCSISAQVKSFYITCINTHTTLMHILNRKCQQVLLTILSDDTHDALYTNGKGKER